MNIFFFLSSEIKVHLLDVFLQVNSKDFTILRIPRGQLDVMVDDDILEIIMKDPKFKKHVQGRKITKFTFRSEIGCGANVSINTKKDVVENISQEKAI